MFQLDASGQPVLVGGQPVVIQLRNCSTRIDAGSFGLCENGGEHIDEKRLEAIP